MSRHCTVRLTVFGLLFAICNPSAMSTERKTESVHTLQKYGSLILYRSRVRLGMISLHPGSHIFRNATVAADLVWTMGEGLSLVKSLILIVYPAGCDWSRSWHTDPRSVSIKTKTTESCILLLPRTMAIFAIRLQYRRTPHLRSSKGRHFRHAKLGPVRDTTIAPKLPRSKGLLNHARCAYSTPGSFV